MAVIDAAAAMHGSMVGSGRATALKLAILSATGRAQLAGKITVIKRVLSGSSVKAAAEGRAVRIEKAAGDIIIKTPVTARALRLVVTKADCPAESASVATAWKYKTSGASMTAMALTEAYRTDRDVAQDMSDYIPWYYDDFGQVQAVNKTEAAEAIRLQAKVQELLDQFYVESATFGLDRWETLVGIEHIPQRSEISRRHFIEAKLRGAGTTTLAMLNDIVNAFYGFETTELPSENAVNFKLVSRRGIPKNLEDIQAAVNDVIPAHIEPRYEFTYLPWNEVETAGLTWEQAETYTWEGLEEAFLTSQQ